MTLNFIDVSEWQAPSVVSNEPGINGVVIRASHGVTEDQNARSHYQAAIARGINNIGFYHYVEGQGVNVETDKFLAVVKSIVGNAKVGLLADWESEYNSAWGNGQYATDFVNEIRRKTGNGWIYTGIDGINQTGATLSSVAPLWFAGYPYFTGKRMSNGFNEIPNFIYDVNPWKDVSMWQFTSSNGALDRSLFYGNDETWDKLASEIGDESITQTPQTTQTPSQNNRTTSGKNLETLAGEVQAGLWGSGTDRSNGLGNLAVGVQTIVNERLGAFSAQQSHEALANETKAGKYGNNPDRAFLLGSYAKVVQDIINNGIQPTKVARTYTIQPGDSLSAIGAKLGVSWQALAQTNGIADPNLIYPGQVLNY